MQQKGCVLMAGHLYVQRRDVRLEYDKKKHQLVKGTMVISTLLFIARLEEMGLLSP